MENKNKLLMKRNDLLQRRADALDQATKAYENGGSHTDYEAAMEKVKGFNGELETLNNLIAETDKSFGEMAEEPGIGMQRSEKAGKQLVDTIRGTEKYLDAWAEAVRKRISLDTGMGYEKLNPLYEAEKAMTITGGDPAGEDGGFLVPMEFDNKVIEAAKDYIDLSELVRVENVRRNNGWRVFDSSGTRTKLQKVGELVEVPKGSKPKFQKISYECEKYGDRLPVSSELYNDAPGLLAYLAQWWAPKYIMTKNDLILTALGKLQFAALTGTTDAEILATLKTVMNTKLSSAHKRNATLLTNCFGFDSMDNMVDGQGRPILTPDPRDPDFSRFKGRPVISGDSDIIPDVTQLETSYHPLYVGDFKAFGALFLRSGIRVASTNVGGDAWATDSVEIKAICRMCFREIDKASVHYTGFAKSV